MYIQNNQFEFNAMRGVFIMKQLIPGIVFACCLALLLPAQTHADLIFSADDVTVNAGSTATVSFYVSDPDGSPGSIFGATYGVDFGDNDSTTLPAGLGFSALVATGSIFTSHVTSPPPAGANANYDIQVDFFNLPPPLGTPVTLTVAPQLLFSLDFTVGAGVANGTVFDIDILGDGESSPNNIFSVTDSTGVEFGGVTQALAGSITVVPEPNLTFVVLAAGGLAFSRRRR